MLAALYERGGPASEVLRVEEVERAGARAGRGARARPRVGREPDRLQVARGAAGPDGVPFQVPNQDGAGVVEAVGAGVDPARVGERVWLYFAAWQRRWGTAAQWTVVPADQAVPLLRRRAPTSSARASASRR